MKQYIFGAVFLIPILFASKVPTPYNLYQIKVWTIASSEGFRSECYPDGKTAQGVQKFSIGFGYNDWGKQSRRAEIAQYLKGGLTWDEGIQITLKELSKYKTGQSDPYTDLAFRLHIYNTGSCKTKSDLKGCCKSKVGCGNPNKAVRKSHNPRRKFEYALATHDFDTVNDMVEGFKEAKEKMWRKHR